MSCGIIKLLWHASETMAFFSSARELLGAVKARYRELHHYTDRGTVEVPHKGRSTAYIVSFETLYESPTDFRIRFKLPHPSSRVPTPGADMEAGIAGGKPYVSTQRPKKEIKLDYSSSLEAAIGSVAGVSMGAAVHSWQLFFSAEQIQDFWAIRRPRFRKFSNRGGILCYRVVGRHSTGPLINVFIGVEDLLIREISIFRGPLRQTERRLEPVVS